MAPKRSKTSYGSQAGPKAKPQFGPEASASSGSSPSLLADAQSSEPELKKKRSLKKRDTEEQVARQMAEHFSDIPKAVLETKRVDGKLVEEHITLHLYATRASELDNRLGKSYWANLRAKYFPDFTVIAQLTVRDPTQAVADRLVPALRGATDTNHDCYTSVVFW
jgi:hypothetical protein